MQPRLTSEREPFQEWLAATFPRFAKSPAALYATCIVSGSAVSYGLHHSVQANPALVFAAGYLTFAYARSLLISDEE